MPQGRTLPATNMSRVKVVSIFLHRHNFSCSPFPFFATTLKTLLSPTIPPSAKPGEEPTEGTPKTQVAIGVTIVVVAVLGLFVVGGVLIGKRKTIR